MRGVRIVVGFVRAAGFARSLAYSAAPNIARPTDADGVWAGALTPNPTVAATGAP
jgi:hypothetical protein